MYTVDEDGDVVLKKNFNQAIFAPIVKMPSLPHLVYMNFITLVLITRRIVHSRFERKCVQRGVLDSRQV